MYTAAAASCRRALSIREEVWGPVHVMIAETLNRLGKIYVADRHYGEGSAMLERAVSILEQLEATGSELNAMVLLNLGDAEAGVGDTLSAVAFMERSISISEKEGRYDVVYAAGLNNAAKLYTAMGDYTRSEDLFERAIPAFEEMFGYNHSNMAKVLSNYASLLRLTGRLEEANNVLD